MNCYSGPFEMMNWTSAEKSCEQKGAHLTSIHSIEENEFIWNNLVKLDTNPTDPMILIGRPMENGLHWNDGTKLNYTNWEDGHYYNLCSNFTECIAIQFYSSYSDSVGQWNTCPCDHPLKYICKKPRQGNCIVFLADRKF